MHDEHNLQVEILVPMKQGGNSCLLGVNIATDNILQMHTTLCPQSLGNFLPPTVYNISDHNLRNDENYATP